MDGAALVLAPGPRPALRRLLEGIDASLPAGDPAASLSRPVRVIVPSRALREHVLSRVVAHRRRPAIGLVVQTLTGAAHEILERADRPAPRAGPLFDLLVERAARRHAPLAGLLERFDTAAGAIAATVRDLLDAGIDRAHRAALEECLEEIPLPAEARRRASAVVGAACALLAELEHVTEPGSPPFGRATDAMREATEALGRLGHDALPTRALFVIGFADVTGRAGDLLERLVATLGGTVIVDRPPHPSETGGAAAAWPFLERLERRLSGLPSHRLPAATPARLEEIVAPGPEAEIRAIAERIRRRLDDGLVPEEIGVVFRQPGIHDAAAITRHFHRLGIPFSAENLPAGLSPAGRRAGALADLLALREHAPVDRLLDAQGRDDLSSRLSDLRLALRACGLVRVSDLASADVGTLGMPGPDLLLPAPGRGEAVDGEEGEPDTAVRIRRRRIPRRLVATARKLAASLLEEFATWPGAAPWERHVVRLERLARILLGRTGGPDAGDPTREALERLRRLGPSRFELTRDEFLRVAGRELDRVGRPGLTARRPGVRVLDALAARGMTFRLLFLPVLTRDVFPRVIEDDPILPDRLRRALEVVLPDIPIKARGWDEERHLFFDLASAADEVVLSRPLRGRDGRDRAESPLLAETRACGAITVSTPARPVHGLEQDVRMPATATAFEIATLARVHRLVEGDGAHGRLLEAAQEEAWAVAGWSPAGLDPRAIGEARARAARELDTVHQQHDLGPSFGFVGRVLDPHDPRRRDGFWAVTVVERYATCPWQMLITRLLRLDPPPDPFSTVPGPSRRIVGGVVHRVVAELATGAPPSDRPRTLDEVVAETPRPLERPDEARLDALLGAAAESVLREEGFGMRGLPELVARRARPFVERALALLGGSDLQALGAEVAGMIRLDGSDELGLAFRVDLVLSDRDGALHLVDLKTGRTPTSLRGSKEETVRGKLLEAVRRGERLQVAAYARALPGNGAAAYLHCDPGAEANERSWVRLAADDPAVDEALHHAVPRMLGGIEAGLFPPRLVDLERDPDSEPGACAYCEVREACRQGDSSATLRLRWWHEGPRRGDAEPHPELRPLLAERSS